MMRRVGRMLPGISAGALVVVMFSGCAGLSGTNGNPYLTDQKGAIVKSSNTEACVRTSDWKPGEACEPVAAPRVAETAPPAPAPARMAPQKVSFSADALFDFDKAVIKPKGKAMLDDLARTLSGVQYDVIQTTGYTDRLGKDAYNMKLSQRRADAVKQYLAAKGIPANRIQAEGRGEANPVTKPGECKGGKGLIACLAPDRRVEVQLTGTRQQ